MRTVLQVVCLISIVLLPTQARAVTCRTEIREELQRLDIAVEDVEWVRLQAIVRKTRGGSRLVGWQAWLTRKSCEGQTVINMSYTCRVRDSFQRGACKEN
ncbi:MAG: hypothetical protein QNJ92_16355 [Alphaproteobacteria bacterium]|nr:hypothetical protein [Alphaproteobacteria bacterium]